MTKINKSYKYRIYPNAEQRQYFAQSFGNARFVYNKMLEDKIKHYTLYGESLKNTPAQYKIEFDFLKLTDSLILMNAHQDLEQAYKNFFRNPGKIGFPKFKRKTNYKTFTTSHVNGNIKIVDGKLKIPKISLLKIKMEREIPADAKLYSVTVTQTASGKYFASINFEIEREIKFKVIDNSDQVVGLDFSMPDLYYSSDGIVANNPKYYRKTQPKLAKEQRKLSKMQKGSNNWHKQRVKVAKIHEKIANQRKDFLHKESREIVNLYDVVCVENLNMQAMSKALNFGKSVGDNGWGMFVNMLEYKLAWQGKLLIKADKWFPSSKQCSHCGELKENLTLADRIYECEECGLKINRDMNATYNLKQYAIDALNSSV